MLSILLVCVFVVPTPFVILRCKDSGWSWVPFLAGYLVFLGLSIMLWVGAWFNYRGISSLLQRSIIITSLLILPVLWITVYEYILHRYPIDIMVVFISAAFILALLASTSLKSENFARLLTFVIIFFIGFSILQVPFGHSRSRSFLEFYSADDNTIDVLFVGNSHIEVTVNESIVDDVLGVNSHVLHDGGIDMVSAYYFIRQSLETQNPRLIVIEAYPLMVKPELSSIMRGQGVLRGRVAFEAMIDRFSVKDYSSVLFPMLYYHSDWALIDNTFVSETIRDYSYLVYPWLTQGLQKRLSAQAGMVTKIVSLEEYMPDRELAIYPENLVYLDKIISLCREHHIDLWLVQSPYTIPPVVDVEAIAQARHLNFYDYNTDQTFNPARVHFKDSAHFNNIGTVLASLRIAELLAEPLGLTIDKESYARYHSVLVKNLTIEVDGEQITYTLDMVEDDTSEVEFAWYVANRDAVLIESPFSSQNSITFTMPENGQYTVQLQIRNRTHPEVSVMGVLDERYDPALAAELGLVPQFGAK
ncbi:MAG: hypothetical protein HY866_17420 [Chloroflexi bacterium]|nr:hypothetical protein [Chloroflexota bacterium]